MARLWEPVGGVFWSVPPAMPNEGGQFLPHTIALLVVAIVGAVVGMHIAKKRKQPEWRLRQHMAELGGAFTLIYLVGITALTWGRIGTLGTMPLNEVGDFLAGAFGPVAFLWLVLGFLQQGDELRMSTKALEDQAKELKQSVEHQSTMAAAALEQKEVRLAELRMQMDDRERALTANFSIQTLFGLPDSEGKIKNLIRISNEGAAATELAISFEPQIPGAHLLKLNDMRTDTHNNYTFAFDPSECADEGKAHVVYLDTESTIRHQSFVYTLDRKARKFGYKKIHEKQG